MSQEGHLLFMTTNHLERLDPALIRPGRVDRRIEARLADAGMAHRMFLLFFPGQICLAQEFAENFRETPVSTAAIQGFLLLYRDEPETAVRRPVEWLAENGHPALPDLGNT